MSKYRTKAGIECTEEECKLIDSFKRLAKNMSQRMSQHQLALVIKGILSNNEMMMMDVLQWCSERFKNSIEKGKKSTN